MFIVNTSLSQQSKMSWVQQGEAYPFLARERERLSILPRAGEWRLKATYIIFFGNTTVATFYYLQHPSFAKGLAREGERQSGWGKPTFFQSSYLGVIFYFQNELSDDKHIRCLLTKILFILWKTKTILLKIFIKWQRLPNVQLVTSSVKRWILFLLSILTSQNIKG